jgi:hypothetical protein
MLITPANAQSVLSGSLNSTTPVDKSSVETKSSKEEISSSGGALLSGVASFAFSKQLTELNISSTETSFTYRKDNSLAIHARSQLNFKARSEEYRFDITLTAESLGLDRSAFADPKKPMTIQLQYAQSELQISHKLSIQEIKTLRTPQEILQDLSEALTEVFRDPGNKSVCYILDSEAIQSLIQSDPKMAELFSELVMVMAMVNLMKRQGEASNDYTIFLSGKGKPYLDIQEEIDGEMINTSYQFNITIIPPEIKETVPAIEAETAAPEEAVINQTA